jgi:hypothetical protein
MSLGVAGCTSSGTPGAGGSADGTLASTQRENALVASLRATPFSEDTVNGFVAVLQDSGIEVVDDVTSTATAAVRVTRWQAENMAAETANGGGVTGRTLAELAPTRPGAPPTPFLVAAWMVEAGSPGARFARALYDPQEFENAYTMRFPSGVLALFLADAAGSPPKEATASSQAGANPAGVGGTIHVEPAVFRASPIDAPCTAASSFVQNAIGAVAKALTIKTAGGGFFGFVAAIWNTAVSLAAKFLSGLIENLTASIVARLVGVFNAIAAVEQISSVLIAWRAPLSPTPTSNRFGVGAETVTGEIALQLQPHVLPVPAAVKDCAQSVGVDISATAAGSKVTWSTTPTPRPDLATTITSGAALDAKESTSLRYRTGQDPEDSLQDPEKIGTLAVSATIRRNDVERLRRLIAELLLAQVPPSLRSLVESLARPILDAATSKLAELTDVHSRTQVPVSYHQVQDRCRPSRIAPGTYEGTVDTDLTNGSAKGHMRGSVTIVVAADQSVTGRMVVETDASAPGLKKMHSVERVAISGTTSRPVATLEKRTIDGKDATFPQSGATQPMSGVCPPGLSWDTGPLSPGTRVPSSGTLVVTATPVP